MNYETRPPRRGLLPELSPELINHVARVEHAVFTKADCRLAWKLFSDIRLWPKFCHLYKEARWQGAPWTPGSRMRLEVGPPVNLTVDRVVTVCIPPHHISWINHARGYTMEQWISIDPYRDGTRISTWIEVTGGELSSQRADDMRLLNSIVSEWFNNYGAECDRVADPERRRGQALDERLR